MASNSDKKRLTATRRKPVLTNRRAITHGACVIATLTWCSLYQCFAALPPNGQLAYWYSGRLPVYRSAVSIPWLCYSFFWNFVPFKFVFNITFHL